MSHKRIDSFSGPGAYTLALRKARFSHHDWLSWQDKDGITQVRRVSRASVKECLLATGTSGRWYLLHASGGQSIGRWQMGINILNQYKYGLR